MRRTARSKILRALDLAGRWSQFLSWALTHESSPEVDTFNRRAMRAIEKCAIYRPRQRVLPTH